MKIVSLNVRGLDAPTKQRLLYNHLKYWKADILMIQET